MRILSLTCLFCLALCLTAASVIAQPVQISGRYPHLAMYNHGGEAGIGAVVPWADRLWVITYSPHKPHGSDDKLYEINDQLQMVARPESIGGTPANRMVHRESQQLFIGPYVIDRSRNVRVIPYDVALGRPTANARHLTDPANKIYTFTMEEGLYEIDVHSLAVKTLLLDGHAKGFKDLLPGYHGKGGYSGQGRLVVANNGQRDAKWSEQLFGPSGTLAEWRGPDSEWHILHRDQFTEVTGPGGIYGNANVDDPIWAVGWDKRSVLLKLLDAGTWHTYRVPMSDLSYVASHGWFTEWPRIREVVPAEGDNGPKLLMNIHGGWFDFPKEFRAGNTGGLRPIGSYLKITGDFAPWGDRIVVGCDDTAITGGNNIAGQSHSNLWFTTWNGLHKTGQPVGWGGPWVSDSVNAETPSDPYLFAGYSRRTLHITHDTGQPITVTVEIDREGAGTWEALEHIEVPAGGYTWHTFADEIPGEWVRLKSDRNADNVTAVFHYGVSAGVETHPAMFASLADAADSAPYSTGIIRPRGGDLGTLHLLAQTVDAGQVTHTGYYEIGADLKLVHKPDAAAERKYLAKHAGIDGPNFSVDPASVIVTDRGQRYRLPRSSSVFDEAGPAGWPRGIREVVTERDLFNAHGTFYVLPKRSTSTGVRGIKPVATHDKRIGDFCSWRGMIVLTGNKLAAPDSPHRIVSDDGKAALWVGDIDDLWKLGKPRGVGGPWKDTAVKPGEPSDPYLMRGYDRKALTLSHNADSDVTITLEVDLLGNGQFVAYQQFKVPAGETVTHEFPAGYSAAWARVAADKACRATATFTYE